jgi:DNA-binding GntR family transcriptional regulator
MECDPVMYLEQIVFLKSGTPVEMSDVWLRGDRYRLSAIVKRDKANSSARMAVEYL